MSDAADFVPVPPAQPPAASPQPAPSRTRLRWWLGSLAALVLLGAGGLGAWRWAERNVLHWGVEQEAVQVTDHARLLERLRAFELATVKQTYEGSAHVTDQQRLAAGPLRVGLPGWVAGQTLDVKGRAVVTAGVDLARVSPADMQVTRQGKDVQVQITLPPPAVLSVELQPDTLDLSTSAGAVTRLRRSVGLSEADLRDRAADNVTAAARDAALKAGILDDAAREAERRLAAFLQSLPQSGGERVSYRVVVKPSPGQ